MAADRSELRLSDAERQEALDALSEHVRTGRLELAEFDERSAGVSTAKFRRDLRPLFADLPEPQPSVLTSPRTASAPQQADPHRTESQRAESYRAESQPVAQPWQQKLASSAVPIAAVVAIVLFFTVAKAWVVFLLPAVVAFAVGALVNRRR